MNIDIHCNMKKNTDDAHNPNGFSFSIKEIFNDEKANDCKWGNESVKKKMIFHEYL